MSTLGRNQPATRLAAVALVRSQYETINAADALLAAAKANELNSLIV